MIYGCGRGESVRDRDTTAPPHDHYRADSGSKWCNQCKMSMVIYGMFWLHFSIVEVEKC